MQTSEDTNHSDKLAKNGETTLSPIDYKNALIHPQVVVTLISGIAPLLIGLTYGYSSPLLPELYKDGRMGKEEGSWFASLGMLGTVIGALLAVFTVDTLGRKTSLILHCIPSTLGWFLMLLGLHTGWTGTPFSGLMHSGRLLTGIAAGMTVITHPVYIAECSTKNIRGLLIVSFQVNIDLGILVIMALGIPWSGKWLTILPLVLSLVLLALMFILPETPRWYIKKGKKTEAEKAMVWLRGTNYNIAAELAETEDILAKEGSSAKFVIKDFTKREVYKPMLLAIALTFFQQACGVTAVVFYRLQICQEAGFSSNPDVIAVVTSAVFLLSDAPSAALTDKAGRRVFLILSELFMAISLGMLGLYFYLTEVQAIQGLSPLSLTGLLVFLVAFSLGMGPIVFVVLPEIFPLRARGTAMGLCIVISYIFGFVIIKYFPILLDAITNYGTFWLFSGVTMIGVIFIAVCIPETKGKSLEEIEEYFRQGSNRVVGEDTHNEQESLCSNESE